MMTWGDGSGTPGWLAGPYRAWISWVRVSSPSVGLRAQVGTGPEEG